MADKLPLVLGSDGKIQQMQAGDMLPSSIVPSSGGGSSFTVQQTPVNNMVKGAAVYQQSADQFDKAQANGSSIAVAYGLVPDGASTGTPCNVQFAGVLELTTTEWDAVTGQSGGLTATAKYYLDPLNPGQMTTTIPTTPGQYVVEMGLALSTTKFVIDIKPPILL